MKKYKWKYRHTVLLLCTLAFFITMVGRLAISPVVPAITDEFEVSNATVGVALSGMWLAYGLSQYPSGILAGRYGERLIILVAILGTTIAALLIAISPLFAVFVAATILLGAAAGLHYSVATTLLAGLYDEVGTAIGIHNTGATVAGLITPIVVTWIGVRYGWRPAVAVVAVIGIAVFILFSLHIRPTSPTHPNTAIRDRVDIESVIELLSRPTITFTLCIAVVSEFAWQGTASFLPTFLVDHRGQSVTVAGLFFSVYFVAQGIGQIAIGVMTDRIGCDRTLITCMLSGALGFVVLNLGSTLGSIFLAVVCIGVGMSFAPAVISRFLQAMSDTEQAAGFGLIRTVYMILASFGSITTGLLADLFGWAVSFGLLFVLLLLIAATLLANLLLDWGY